jgi:hypothetical protein
MNMAEAAHLSEDVLAEVARTVASSVTLAFERYAPDVVELGEAFELWYLAGIVEDDKANFNARVEFTGRYHHQIFVNGSPAGFAVSTRPASGQAWKVTRLVPSTLAADIDAAVDILDRALPQAVPVCLVTAPAYLVTAFWVRDGLTPRLFVVSCPPSNQEMKRRVFLSPEEFIAALAREQASGALTRPQ